MKKSLESLLLKFTSSNGIPVTRAYVTLEEYQALTAEIDRLQTVVGEAYQVCGWAGAPERVLDNLSDASSGRPLRHESMLPVLLGEFSHERDALEHAIKMCESQRDEILSKQTGEDDAVDARLRAIALLGADACVKIIRGLLIDLGPSISGELIDEGQK